MYRTLLLDRVAICLVYRSLGVTFTISIQTLMPILRVWMSK